jgi:hypothetical protein
MLYYAYYTHAQLLKIWDEGKKLTDAEFTQVCTTTSPHAFLCHHDRVDADGNLVELGPKHVNPPHLRRHQPSLAPAFVSRASACWGPSFSPPEAQLAEDVATNMLQNSRDTANNSGAKPVGARVPSVYVGQVPGAGAAAQEGVSMFSSLDSVCHTVPATLGIPLTVLSFSLSLFLSLSLSFSLCHLCKNTCTKQTCAHTHHTNITHAQAEERGTRLKSLLRVHS